jgi:GDPmannose 4,6-dehydratase
MKKALIIGANGQGRFISFRLLLEKNYEVHGIIRRSSAQFARIRHIVDNCDLTTVFSAFSAIYFDS